MSLKTVFKIMQNITKTSLEYFTSVRFSILKE